MIVITYTIYNDMYFIGQTTRHRDSVLVTIIKMFSIEILVVNKPFLVEQ